MMYITQSPKRDSSGSKLPTISVPEELPMYSFDDPHKYPNKWRETTNLSKITLQITNRNRFNPQDMIHPNIDNDKYFETIK